MAINYCLVGNNILHRDNLDHFTDEEPNHALLEPALEEEITPLSHLTTCVSAKWDQAQKLFQSGTRSCQIRTSYYKQDEESVTGSQGSQMSHSGPPRG